MPNVQALLPSTRDPCKDAFDNSATKDSSAYCMQAAPSEVLSLTTYSILGSDFCGDFENLTCSVSSLLVACTYIVELMYPYEAGCIDLECL